MSKFTIFVGYSLWVNFLLDNTMGFLQLLRKWYKATIEIKPSYKVK